MDSFLNGAECGPSNALQSVSKHFESDRSLQKDRVGGPSQSTNLHHLPSSSTSAPSAADQALARQFFDATSGSAGPSFAPAPFTALGAPGGFNAMSHVVNVPHHQQQAIQGPLSSAVSLPQIQQSSSSSPSQWAVEFQPAFLPQQAQSSAVSSMSSQVPFNSAYTPAMTYGMGMGSMYTPMAAQPNWSQAFSSYEPATTTDKGKGRLVEVDNLESLEKAFEEASLDAGAVQSETGKAKASDEGKLEDYMASFETVWKDIQAQNPEKSLEELSQMEADYRQLLQQNEELDWEDPDMLRDMNETWKTYDGVSGDMFDPDFGMNEMKGMVQYDDNGVPVLEPYEFEPNNSFLSQPTQGSLLTSAKGLLASNGSLQEAALLIEASIQKGELGEGGYEAWLLLGRARSMDEREAQALRALREGTRLASENGHQGAGLLDLAISYTNESFDLASHHSLRQWLRAKYPTLAASTLDTQPATSFKQPWSSHSLTSDAFIAVARDLHAKGQSDPDLQIGLGVLFYVNGDYDKATDCFENALASRPDDYLLWNRLGSALSNGSKPEEALGPYREALRLRPTYTRAIYNVGVACLNIGAHKEAAEHFLSALTLRGADRDPSSSVPPVTQEDHKNDQIWQTLEKTFSLMERPDLVGLAQQGNVEAFRGEFDY